MAKPVSQWLQGRFMNALWLYQNRNVISGMARLNQAGCKSPRIAADMIRGQIDRRAPSPRRRSGARRCRQRRSAAVMMVRTRLF
jgi:hypothetical protein